LLAAPTVTVWARVTTPAGVNDELAPWLRMTVPAKWRGASLEDIEPGTRIGRSWVLLLGLVPFDYDDLSIAESGPGRFLEQSTMLSMRFWQHERTVEDAPGGCEVRDRLTFEPRWYTPAPLARAIVAAIFRHRHRRLVRAFGAAAQ
jgi:ligand-binding SRPBCC domain-containing protein